MTKNTFAFITVLTITLTGCGVELTYDGRNTVVGNPEEIKSCRHLGNTSLSLPIANTKILNKEKIRNNLQIEARNFAGRIGADTVIPIGELSEDGKQLFRLYNCNLRNKKKI